MNGLALVTMMVQRAFPEVPQAGHGKRLAILAADVVRLLDAALFVPFAETSSRFLGPHS